MVDTLALGASAARREGSNPSPPTNIKPQFVVLYLCWRERANCFARVRDLKPGAMRELSAKGGQASAASAGPKEISVRKFTGGKSLPSHKNKT